MGYIKHSVESIEQKIDKFADMYATRKEFDELKRSVNSLMRWRYYFTGGAAVIGVAASKLIDVLTVILTVKK